MADHKPEYDGLDNAVETKGRVKVLQAMQYKGYWIYVRQIDVDIFIYDAIYEGQNYSQHMIITPKKGEKELSKEVIAQAQEMCYAGACATIDTLMGVKLSDQDQAAVDMMESKRAGIEKADNGGKSKQQ